ncbi:hypothetical protein DEO72_LG8g751 [Vigna unguiculata]|uniref:Uncharacterized protein n=1 Tax=Vigna unguiculata TaxID=3917 RepID=A0A4D6MMN0_VIGUN|nr:hypothetical protein DEO72_LG8g751 [Vigna unguiculata]
MEKEEQDLGNKTKAENIDNGSFRKKIYASTTAPVIAADGVAATVTVAGAPVSIGDHTILIVLSRRPSCRQRHLRRISHTPSRAFVTSHICHRFHRAWQHIQPLL